MNKRNSYLDFEIKVFANSGADFADFANDDNTRLVSYDMMALFSSSNHKTSGGGNIEYMTKCNPNLLMYKLFSSCDE